MTTDEHLLFSLHRLTAQVAKDAPSVASVLSQHLVATLGNLVDSERACRYRELGGLLMDLGRIYQQEADALDLADPSGASAAY